ncbi:MAG: asparaginase [Gemmatimonadota bacterium]|nr:asparaginase [Gemmatimonadota bacterium]
MRELTVRSYRGNQIETVHKVRVVVSDLDGNLVDSTEDAGALKVPTRSAAKPFQALPLLADGVVESFRLSQKELAISVASHNSEAAQVAVVARWMERLGFREENLVCGSHRPLAKELGFHEENGKWETVAFAPPSRMASNCSGKHAGMLSLAAFHGWDISDYGNVSHPVQDRYRSMIAQWCEIGEEDIGDCVDGCGAVSWVMPLGKMAHGFAKLARPDGLGAPIVEAMTTYPELVAGKRRLCTAIMRAFRGKLIAKVGAGGVYGGALLDRKLGIALKVEDGDGRAAAAAFVAVVESLLQIQGRLPESLRRFQSPVILNTQGRVVGRYRAEWE